MTTYKACEECGKFVGMKEIKLYEDRRNGYSIQWVCKKCWKNKVAEERVNLAIEMSDIVVRISEEGKRNGRKK